LPLDFSFVCSVCQAVERNPNQVLHLFLIWCWRKYEIKLVVLFWVVGAEGIKAGAKAAAIVAIATAIPTVRLLFSQWPSLSIATCGLLFSIAVILAGGITASSSPHEEETGGCFLHISLAAFFSFSFPFLALAPDDRV
jgi:hypothetical protein